MGRVRAGWQSLPFEECIEPVVYTTKVQRKDFLSDGDYPVVSQEEAFVNGYWNDEADVFRVERPIVIFGDHTRVLKYVDFDFVLGADGVKVLKPRPFLHPRFFYYQLHTAKLDALGYARHYRLLREHRVAFPPYAAQRRIVAILDEAFEGIATAKANAEKNLQNARELADVLGEACFDEHIDDRFQSRDLASLCDLIVDCEHKTAPTQEHGFPSIRTPNIGKGRLILDDVNRVSETTYAAWTRRAVPLAGDLILAREAPAGNVAVIPEGMHVCLGQRTVLIRPRREVFKSEYLAHLLLQRRSQRRLLDHSRGATVQHINMKDIRAFMITSVPSLDTQAQVIRKLADIDEACQSLLKGQAQKLAALDELKKSLFQLAFSGALTSGKLAA